MNIIHWFRSGTNEYMGGRFDFDLSHTFVIGVTSLTNIRDLYSSVM
jgi:hypothetical protein